MSEATLILIGISLMTAWVVKRNALPTFLTLDRYAVLTGEELSAPFVAEVDAAHELREGEEILAVVARRRPLRKEDYVLLTTFRIAMPGSRKRRKASWLHRVQWPGERVPQPEDPMAYHLGYLSGHHYYPMRWIVAGEDNVATFHSLLVEAIRERKWAEDRDDFPDFPPE